METGAYGLVLRPILGEKILGGGRSVHFTEALEESAPGADSCSLGNDS